MFVALTVVIFLNPWTFRIMQHNLLIVFLIFMMSALLYKAMSGTITKKITVFCVMLLIPIMVFQWKTTTPQSLTLLENDEQRVRETRLTFYNPSSHYVRLLFYKLNLKNFLEGELHTASFRIQRNFFESIDPNIYFFGGHPRARVWANDFEKFPFILIFPFLIGMYLVVRRKLFLIWGIVGLFGAVYIKQFGFNDSANYKYEHFYSSFIYRLVYWDENYQFFLSWFWSSRRYRWNNSLYLFLLQR